MCRGKLPGHLLHEWVVVKFVRDPKFNCIAFDKTPPLEALTVRKVTVLYYQ